MKLYLLAFLLGSSPANAGPVEIQPGVEYEAGQRIGVGSLGISLQVPPEWIAGIPEGAEALLMGSTTKVGLVLISAETGVTAEQIAAELAKPQPLEGMVLKPDATPTVEGGTVRARYTATPLMQPFVGHARALVGKNGTSVLIVAVGPAEHDAYYGDLVGTIAKSVEFGEIVKPQAPKSDGGSWDQKIRGMQLAYLKSDTGFYDERRLWLCSDGTFFWKDQAGAFSSDVSGDFSASLNDAQTGTWSVEGSTLHVVFQNGNAQQWALSANGNQTLVNGTRWFVVENDRCR